MTSFQRLEEALHATREAGYRPERIGESCDRLGKIGKHCYAIREAGNRLGRIGEHCYTTREAITASQKSLFILQNGILLSSIQKRYWCHGRMMPIHAHVYIFVHHLCEPLILRNHDVFCYTCSLAYISKRCALVQVLPLCKSYCFLHICMSSQHKNLVYTFGQEVPKLVYTFWTCKPVCCTSN